MSWVILVVAGLFEVAWSVGLKAASADPRPLIVIGTGLAIVASMVLLAVAMKNIPLGTAYAIWTCIGALGAFVVGIVCFNEPPTFGRICSVLLILAGLIGLKLSHG